MPKTPFYGKDSDAEEYRMVDSLTAHWYFTKTDALVEWTVKNYDWDDCKDLLPGRGKSWIEDPAQYQYDDFHLFRVKESTIVY